MKKITLSILFFSLVFILNGNAQQDPQYTQYMYNMNVMNPAYAGSKETLSIGLLGRKQWISLNGAPTTFTGAIHAPISKSLGAGFSVIADELGPVKEQNIYADLSYTIQTSEFGKLAFGLKGGVTLQQIGLFSLAVVDPTDDSFSDNVNTTDPNIGAGAFYYTDKFYVGFSAPNILATKRADISNNKIKGVSNSVHYFLTSGYVFDLNDNLKFKPSFMVKATSGAPVSVDLSTNFLFNERFEIGASYRVEDSVSGLVNFTITKGFRLGFAYDYTLSNLGDFNKGSIEGILLWDIVSSEKKIRSPRFF